MNMTGNSISPRNQYGPVMVKEECDVKMNQTIYGALDQLEKVIKWNEEVIAVLEERLRGVLRSGGGGAGACGEVFEPESFDAPVVQIINRLARSINQCNDSLNRISDRIQL